MWSLWLIISFNYVVIIVIVLVSLNQILIFYYSLDAIEDPSLTSNTSPRTTTNAPRRRPLVQLKNDQDQSPSATNEEEKKRQSKKYSSSFKQNQLDEILKFRASSEDIDVTTEGKTTLEGM